MCILLTICFIKGVIEIEALLKIIPVAPCYSGIRYKDVEGRREIDNWSSHVDSWTNRVDKWYYFDLVELSAETLELVEIAKEAALNS